MMHRERNLQPYIIWLLVSLVMFTLGCGIGFAVMNAVRINLYTSLDKRFAQQSAYIIADVQSESLGGLVAGGIIALISGLLFWKATYSRKDVLLWFIVNIIAMTTSMVVIHFAYTYYNSPIALRYIYGLGAALVTGGIIGGSQWFVLRKNHNQAYQWGIIVLCSAGLLYLFVLVCGILFVAQD